MSHLIEVRAITAQEIAAWEEWEAEKEAAARPDTDSDCNPLLAAHVPVADLQHWIDLCA
jgi:hypothetical protein